MQIKSRRKQEAAGWRQTERGLRGVDSQRDETTPRHPLSNDETR